MAAPASRVRSASSADTARPWLVRSATAAAFRPVSRATIITSAPASASAVANALPSPWFPPGDDGLAAVQRETLQYPHTFLLRDGFCYGATEYPGTEGQRTASTTDASSACQQWSTPWNTT